MSGLQKIDLQEIQALLVRYFPYSRILEDDSAVRLEDGSLILIQKDQIIPYLQTALFEEHLLEVQIGNTPRVFSSTLFDELPSLAEKIENGELCIVAVEYEPGSYLKAGASFLLAPLTPCIGNAIIRQSKNVVVRFFVGATSIEFGSVFLTVDEVREQPVLRLDFPCIVRINKGIRPYRVKLLSSIDAKVTVLGSRFGTLEGKNYQIVDISPNGIGFSLKNDMEPMQIGEELHIAIKVADQKELQVKGCLKRLTNVRSRYGLDWICGMQFDLETQVLAGELERLAAAVQRFQLRELAEKTAGLTGVRIIR